MHRITARGPASAALLDLLPDSSRDARRWCSLAQSLASTTSDATVDEDVQLTLFLLYELHYGGLPWADERWEWAPELLAPRAALEVRFERDVRRELDDGTPLPSPSGLPAALFDLTSGSSGRSVASYVAREATLEQVTELLVLRSVSQLREADGHTWAIPRLRGAAKAALVEIQADEYGGGRVERMHATLFARCMRALGLSDRPNHYLDAVPGTVLASVNLVSMLGLHRRLRGALCGHLTAFEMTSSLPSRRMVSGLERLGLGADATEYFDEHVEADALHEQVAAHDLCGNLVREEPRLLPDVLLGARACLLLEGRVGDHVLDRWTAGDTALRAPLRLSDVVHRNGRPTSRPVSVHDAVTLTRRTALPPPPPYVEESVSDGAVPAERW